jgi:hypothetical protein
MQEAGVLVLELLRAQAKPEVEMVLLWAQHQTLAVLLQLILDQVVVELELIQLLRLVETVVLD